MWTTVRLGLSLSRDTALDRSESFVQWLIPRAPNVRSLTVVTRRADSAAGEGLLRKTSLVQANIVSAITLVGPHLQELSVQWAGQLVISGWSATLSALRVASFAAESVVVRPGLGYLSNLRDLRFKSVAAPLVVADAVSDPRSTSTLPRGLLPPGLFALRMDNCRLTALPPSVAALRQLTDLVLSNNELAPSDLAPLSQMTTLRQLTLMGTRMSRLPQALSTLTALRVLYLDGVAGAADADEVPTHAQVSAALGPLRLLGILSLGSSRLDRFPTALTGLSRLRALYLDNNPGLATLPDGPYLRGLRVLGMDWRTLFASHALLSGAPRLRKLCLTAFGGIDAETMEGAGADEVSESLMTHPSLQLLLLPMVDGNRVERLFIAPLNVALRLSASPQVEVKAVTYSGISNEWIEWLEEVEAEERSLASL
jgi:hypothetical protein